MEDFDRYKNAAAVLLPLLDVDGERHLLFEHRSKTIEVQPGEVSFPGGMHEEGESIEETAVRETAEELLLAPAQIKVVGALDPVPGVGRIVYPFVGALSSYEGTYSKEEVDHVFTVPLAFLKAYVPRASYTETVIRPAPDFPYELIPGGRDYPWHTGRTPVYFYEYGDEMIWGLTARILHAYLQQV